MTEANARRLAEIREQIKEVENNLSDPNNDGLWCLGDPYELLDWLKKEEERINRKTE